MQENNEEKSRTGRNLAIVACIAVVWIVLDYVTKQYFNGGEFALGQHIAGPFLGLFRFTLVHNTGAAWGLFAGNTMALGVFSLVMCVLLLVYLFTLGKNASLGQVIGIGLVVGGGIGNAIDRLGGSYVVDFIDFTFMDFPVFNVADIGVTCGVVIFILFMLVDMRHDEEKTATAAPLSGTASADQSTGELQRDRADADTCVPANEGSASPDADVATDGGDAR